MTRGQATTLEAVIAALVLLSGVVFALQMTAVTPLSASTSSQHIENQLEGTADGVITTAARDGSLERAVLFYNESVPAFVDAGSRGYYNGAPPNHTFGRVLDWAFDRRGVAYNVAVTYAVDGADRTRRMVYRGRPSDNAVRVSTTLVLTDDTPLYRDGDGDGIAEPRDTTVSEVDGFYAPDRSTSAVYNTVRVEVVAWRI